MEMLQILELFTVNLSLFRSAFLFLSFYRLQLAYINAALTLPFFNAKLLLVKLITWFTKFTCKILTSLFDLYISGISRLSFVSR